MGTSNHLIYYSLDFPSNKAKLIMFVSLLLSWSPEEYLGGRFTELLAILVRGDTSSLLAGVEVIITELPWAVTDTFSVL